MTDAPKTTSLSKKLVEIGANECVLAAVVGSVHRNFLYRLGLYLIHGFQNG